MIPSQLVRLEVLGFLAALGLAVVWKLLTRRITTRGLLTDPTTGALSPVRLQLMVATLVGAASYLSEVAHAEGAWPEPGVALLAVVGGSNAIHLGTWLWASVRRSRSLEALTRTREPS